MEQDFWRNLSLENRQAIEIGCIEFLLKIHKIDKTIKKVSEDNQDKRYIRISVQFNEDDSEKTILMLNDFSIYFLPRAINKAWDSRARYDDKLYRFYHHNVLYYPTLY